MASNRKSPAVSTGGLIFLALPSTCLGYPQICRIDQP